MYNLENNVAWTDNLKNAFKHGVTRCQINLGNGIVYDENNNLLNAELVENRNVPNLGFIGQATARQLTIELMSIDENINLENREIEFKIGADYNEQTYYINYGKFIVTKAPENDDTNGKIKIIAYDYMIKFNKLYVPNTIFPCSLQLVFNDVCLQCGVGIGSTSFPNSDFIVDSNQFEGKTCREVLQNIAMCAFSWARIKQDNRCYLDFNCCSMSGIPGTLPVGYDTYITNDDYKTNAFKKANEYYGPVDKVTFGQANIIGQEESIPSNATVAEHELVLYDNLFAYTTAKRRALINNGTSLLGLLYMPIQQMDLVGLVYLEGNDFFQVTDMDENKFYSYPLNHTIKYNGAVSDSISSEAQSINEQTYRNENASNLAQKRTEIIVDRAKGEISLIAEQTLDKTNPDSLKSITTELRTRVGEIESEIQSIGDITTQGESDYAKVTLEDVNESEPVTIKVRPTVESIEYLHPKSTGLYPSNTLFLKNRSIRFLKLSKYIQTTDTTYTSYKKYYTKNNSVYTLLILGEDYTAGDTISGTVYEHPFFDYEIPGDLLYINSETYDEFYLDYNERVCQIIKKCGYNADGTIYALQSQRIDTYPYPTILLEDGDYEISLPSYDFASLFVRLMAKNIYTDQFYTKVQTNSLVSQTASNITSTVNQTLSNNYYDKVTTESKISQGVNDLSLSVSQNYATQSALNGETQRATNVEGNLSASINLKLNTADLISEINASADVITLAGGSSINLSSAGKLIISAGNFKLDGNGNMTATNGNFSGTINSTSGTIGGWSIGANTISATNSSGNRVSLSNASDTYQNFLVVRTGAGTSQSPYEYPFYVRGDGTMYATKGSIGGINITNSGIFSYGNSDYVGFGIWKQGLHQSENSSIIFHAGGNTAHIGGAMTRIYADGNIHTRGIYYTARDTNTGAVLGTPLRIRARYNTSTQANQGEIDILQGDFGVADLINNEAPIFISTSRKIVGVGAPDYDNVTLYNARNLYFINGQTYGGNVITHFGFDHHIMFYWTGSQLDCYIDGQRIGRVSIY